MADSSAALTTDPAKPDQQPEAPARFQASTPVADVETLDGLRIAPAAHLAQLMADATVEGERGVALRELEFPMQIGLRATPGSEAARALEDVLGFALPERYGQVTGDPDGLHVLWLAPDELLAVDVSRHQVPDDAAPYEKAVEGIPGQAVDLSANRACLVLSGPSACDVLEKGCQLDLHPREFPTGTAVVSQVSLVPVLLHRSGDEEWRLYPRRSFADFLVRWIADAMAEFASPSPEEESRRLAVR